MEAWPVDLKVQVRSLGLWRFSCKAATARLHVACEAILGLIAWALQREVVRESTGFSRAQCIARYSRARRRRRRRAPVIADEQTAPTTPTLPAKPSSARTPAQRDPPRSARAFGMTTALKASQSLAVPAFKWGLVVSIVASGFASLLALPSRLLCSYPGYVNVGTLGERQRENTAGRRGGCAVILCFQPDERKSRVM